MDQFWKAHKPDDYSAGGYLSTAEVEKLIDSGETAYVVGVGDPEPGFKNSTKRVVTFDIGGDERLKSFTLGMKGRDKLLEDMATYLAGGGGPVPVRFASWGAAHGLEPAGFPEPPAGDEDGGVG